MPLAITLIIAAFTSAFLISTYSNKGENYWVIAQSMSPGHVISASDLEQGHLNLGASARRYLRASDTAIGLVATRTLRAGDLISTADLTPSIHAMTTSAVPLSLRAADLASGVSVGEPVDIYWVLDARSGEEVINPILILGGVTVIGLDDSKNSLGGDTSITVAIEQTQVLRMLSATTQGRLVVVRTNV